MNQQQAQYVLQFFKSYSCFSLIKEETLLEALLQTPTDGRGFSKILKVNSSYVSHEIARKIPKNILTKIKRSKGSWIYNILLDYDRCPICKGVKKTLSNITCSNSCANTYFRSGINNPNFKEDSSTAYIRICFSFHKKQCVICKEDKIVAVHHFDENHSNNEPDNLIPLCPTHHQYIHSKYKHLVEEQIIIYRNNFKSCLTQASHSDH